MRGGGQTARAVAAAVVVVAALALVALASRSGRTETVTPVTTAASATPYTPPSSGRYRQLDDGEVDTSTRPPDPSAQVGALVFVVLAAVLAGLALFCWIVVERVRMRTGPVRRQVAPKPTPPDQPTTVTDPIVLAAAVDAGLRLLEEGEPGEGVVACWVQLERAAADAGTDRAPPETPSELAGRLIDTHDVMPGPLLRLAELYREARYSRHTLPESARTEAREMLEQVRADLALATASTAAGWGRPSRGASR